MQIKRAKYLLDRIKEAKPLKLYNGELSKVRYQFIVDSFHDIDLENFQREKYNLKQDGKDKSWTIGVKNKRILENKLKKILEENIWQRIVRTIMQWRIEIMAIIGALIAIISILVRG